MINIENTNIKTIKYRGEEINKVYAGSEIIYEDEASILNRLEILSEDSEEDSINQ